MKMNEIDYSYLKKEILEKHKSFSINEHRKWLKKYAIYKDLEKRLRWDFFNSILKDNMCFINTLYIYLNDNHIDTALKNIIKEIEEGK